MLRGAVFKAIPISFIENTCMGEWERDAVVFSLTAIGSIPLDTR